MKLPILSSALLALLSSTKVVFANNFAGANNYYAASLSQTSRYALLNAMQAANMKVLRTWVSGHSAGQKGSDNTAVNDLEWQGVGTYDDTILNAIDQLMVDAHARGIKLLIGMYDVNALDAGDVYTAKYGSKDAFFTNSAAVNAFYQRITHILNGHKNSLVSNLPWSELSAYIFGFEPMNEPMIYDSSFYQAHLSWICGAAQQIRNNVGNPNQLIFTGGGSASLSYQSYFLSSSCPAIDVIAVHDYNDDYDSFMSSAISATKSAGKKLMVEEWGSLYGSGQTANLQSNIAKINNYQVPWLYWEPITNADPHEGEDYEIQVGTSAWSIIASGAESTAQLSGAFDWSGALAM
ncbi:glycoside hydrolase [Clavulina sp. PMI_390]|nr:glycoside hydrolase [Clavulina sp. PMI_390]